MSEPIRLARRVAEQLNCTRADAEQYIKNGWVLVNGEVIELPQHPISDEHVDLHPDARLEPVEPATILLHKPAGIDFDQGDQPAAALVNLASHWSDDGSGVRPLQRHFQHLSALVPLDTDASGLMVLSQDDRIRRRLTEEGSRIEHEYLVEVSGEIAPYGLHRLQHGLSVAGRALAPCKVSWQNETRLRFAIKGARAGQLHDMCKQVGLEVVSIRRLRIGSVPLGKGPTGAMPPGQWRYLNVGDRF